MPPKIAVVGSLNVDLFYRVATIPRPGETVASHGVITAFGGKGANQAVAAHRAGGQVSLIGTVGDDDQGLRYVEALHNEGVNVEAVRAHPALPTGSAIILLEDSGENSIIVEAGANQATSQDSVDAAKQLIEEADILLLQFETPSETIHRAAEIARAAGVAIVINPSPWRDDFPSSGIPCDHLITNETEAAKLLACDESEVAETGGKALGQLGVQTLVITRGSSSTLAFSSNDDQHEIPVKPVTPVDTVGAGDAFAGAYAVAIAEGRSLPEALRFANAAGGLATLKLGAQPSIPHRTDIEAAL